MRARLLEPLVLFLAAILAAPAAAQCPSAADGFDLGGVEGRIEEVAVLDLGNGPRLFVTGELASAAGGTAVACVAEWDGGAWRSLGSGLHLDASSPRPAVGHALLSFDDGTGARLVVGGRFDRAGGVAVSNVATWDGQAWQPMGTAIGDVVSDLEVLDDGSGPTLWASTFADVQPYSGALHRWNGTDWTQVATTDHAIHDIAAFDDGSGPALFVGGSFTAPFAALAKWNGSAWSQVGGGLSTTAASPQSRPSVWTLTVWDDGTGPALYVGGYDLDGAGSAAVRDVARWDGASWSPVGVLSGCQELAAIDLGGGPKLYTSPGAWVWDGVQWNAPGLPPPQGNVRAITALDRGNGPELVLAGNLMGDGWRNIASWDGVAWNPFGAPGDGIDPAPLELLVAGPSGSARLLALTDRLLARNAPGWTTEVDWYEVTPMKGVGVFDPATGEPFLSNGSWLLREQPGGWVPWAIATGQIEITRWLDAGDGMRLYVGGSFYYVSWHINFATSRNVVAWDGSAWLTLGTGVEGKVVHALEVFDDGGGPDLYAAGDLGPVGSADNVARWDGTTWQPLGATMDGKVSAMAAWDDGSGSALYAAGSFRTVAGLQALHVARWDGVAWSAVGAGLVSDGPISIDIPHVVTDLIVFDDGNGEALYVGGSFHHAGGAPAANLARWDGTTWSALGTGASGPVTTLEVFDDGGGDALWIGGAFHAFDGVPAANIARWGDRCASEASVAFCTATDDACPCGNGGDGTGGCDTPQATGGVRLELASLVPGAGTSEVATLRGSGFPSTTSPAVLLLRAGDWAREHVPFGDGLACLGSQSAVADVRLASSGTTTHVVTEQDGAGARYYQLRYRSNPAAFCDATAAFNTSNAFKVTW